MTYPTTEELIEAYGKPDDLAGDGSLTNRGRVDRAWEAVQTYMARVYTTPYSRADFENADSGCAREVITDLICDLLHLATFCGEEPEPCLSSGELHFQSEAGLGYDA